MEKFDDEFKGNAVKLVREEGLKIGEVARGLGIGLSTLKGWLSKIERFNPCTFIKEHGIQKNIDHLSDCFIKKGYIQKIDKSGIIYFAYKGEFEF